MLNYFETLSEIVDNGRNQMNHTAIFKYHYI